MSEKDVRYSFPRNFEEIRKILDPAVRQALVSCQDSDLLSRLKIGFPECFLSEGPKETTIPLSQIREVIRRGLQIDDIPSDDALIREFGQGMVLHLVDKNSIFLFRETYPDVVVEEMPDDLLQRYEEFEESEQILDDSPCVVVANGQRCLLLYAYSDEFKELLLLPCAGIEEIL